MRSVTPEMLVGTPWHKEYVSIAPNPSDFGQLVERIKQFNSKLGDFDEEKLEALEQPFLLISGDADNASIEHMAAFHRLLGGQQPVSPTGAARSWLHILPGTSHAFVPARADLIVPSVETFLNG